jgi:hypothetical protein
VKNSHESREGLRKSRGLDKNMHVFIQFLHIFGFNTSKKALVLAGYKCEYEKSHIFFKSSVTGQNLNKQLVQQIGTYLSLNRYLGHNSGWYVRIQD